MVQLSVSGGTLHDLPDDLKKTLSSSKKVLAAWEDITPLARMSLFVGWNQQKKMKLAQKELRERRKSFLRASVVLVAGQVVHIIDPQQRNGINSIHVLASIPLIALSFPFVL